jgi:hypothetical protein
MNGLRLASIRSMSIATRTFVALALSGLVCSSAGCAETIDTSRGKYEQVLSRQIVAYQPASEEGDVRYMVARRRLGLSLSYRRICEQRIREEFQVVERVDHRARSNWWIMPLVGLASTSLGVMVLANAHNQPTEGVDPEGRQSNLRNDAYGIGTVCLAGGLLALMDFPLVGVRDHVRSSDSRIVSEAGSCGPARPYVGAITVVRGDRSVESRTDASGRASVDLASLAGVDPGLPVSVVFGATGVHRSLDLAPEELVELGIE